MRHQHIGDEEGVRFLALDQPESSFAAVDGIHGVPEIQNQLLEDPANILLILDEEHALACPDPLWGDGDGGLVTCRRWCVG